MQTTHVLPTWGSALAFWSSPGDAQTYRSPSTAVLDQEGLGVRGCPVPWSPIPPAARGEPVLVRSEEVVGQDRAFVILNEDLAHTGRHRRLQKWPCRAPSTQSILPALPRRAGGAGSKVCQLQERVSNLTAPPDSRGPAAPRHLCLS